MDYRTFLNKNQENPLVCIKEKRDEIFPIHPNLLNLFSLVAPSSKLHVADMLVAQEAGGVYHHQALVPSYTGPIVII